MATSKFVFNGQANNIISCLFLAQKDVLELFLILSTKRYFGYFVLHFFQAFLLTLFRGNTFFIATSKLF
jgi:hypothetical protein